MDDKYRGKYRIPPARAEWWDYSQDGAYFITLCTAHRARLFGDIREGNMQLSPIGKMVEEEWEKSFQIRNELFCDEWVIMPDHIHAIVIIARSPVETHGRASLREGRASLRGMAYRAPRSVSSFVAGFKSAATHRINQYRKTPDQPVWQPRFHDHIIRDEKEYKRITEYIKNNPRNWVE